MVMANPVSVMPQSYGFPAFPRECTDPNTGGQVAGLRELSGYLPDAFVNFLALLGWNPGNQEEIFSKEQLIEAFTVERIGKSGTKFDINKANWFNEIYLRAKPNVELAEYLLASLKQEGIACTPEKAAKVCGVMKERATFPTDFWKEGKFFFLSPTSFDEKIAEKKWNNDTVNALTAYKEELLANTETITPELAKALLTTALEKKGIGMGKVMQGVRLAITGVGAGPDLMEVIEIIGKEEVIKRIDFAIDNLKAYIH